ncbi:DUF302 domain-containing protein [bacterium]|nr:DUF302 domain-containing protein [bacterium]
MSSPTDYGIRVTTDLDYESAVDAVTASLKDQGFGVLTEIDVKATLKRKIGVNFRRYIILGACNPELAHRALKAEIDLGLLLPCNVIVYEGEEGTVVVAIDPKTMVTFVDNAELSSIATEAESRLRAALETVAS